MQKSFFASGAGSCHSSRRLASTGGGLGRKETHNSLLVLPCNLHVAKACWLSFYEVNGYNFGVALVPPWILPTRPVLTLRKPPPGGLLGTTRPSEMFLLPA